MSTSGKTMGALPGMQGGGVSESIETTIPGDWRILAGILDADLRRAQYRTQVHEEHNGFYITVCAGDVCQIAADVILRAVGGSTSIQVKMYRPQAEYWQTEMWFLAEAMTSALSFDELTRPTAMDVIQLYYRRKAAGTRVTMRQLAEETRYSLAYLKTAKRRYDAAGKWGSKKKSPASDE